MFIQKRPKQLVEPKLLVGTRKEMNAQQCHLLIQRNPKRDSKHRTYLFVEGVSEQVVMKCGPFPLLIVLLVSEIDNKRVILSLQVVNMVTTCV
jgi:hypothetical protein